MSPLQVLFFVEGAVANFLVKYIARYFKRANSGSAPMSCPCLAHVLHMSCTCLAHDWAQLNGAQQCHVLNADTCARPSCAWHEHFRGPSYKSGDYRAPRWSSRSRIPIVLPDSFIARCISPHKTRMHEPFEWWKHTISMRNETIGQHDRAPWSGWWPRNQVPCKITLTPDLHLNIKYM